MKSTHKSTNQSTHQSTNPSTNRPTHQPTTQPATSSQPAPTANSSDSAAQLTAALAERTADLQRTRADFENFRKQTELQKQQAIAAARYATVAKFLPLIDDLDRALSAYPDQLSPLAKNIAKTTQSLGLERINSDPGTDFNPDFHEAVSVTDEGGDREVVAATLRAGYLYEGSVLRPAMVQVKRVANS